MVSVPVHVSVVIPAYNSERTLHACLSAVYAQTLPPVEVIVVDDASTDQTREIARQFPVRLLQTPVNSGPAAARNRGIKASTGELIFFVDADCAPTPTALATALRVLADEPAVDCVHGIYLTEPLYDDGPVEAYRLLHAHYWRAINTGRVRTAIFALCVVRRCVFDDVGLFDERLRASEDVEISDRMADRHGIWLSADMTCHHDDDSRLGPLLRKQFSRSQLLVPVAVRERGPAGLRANRMGGVLATTAVLVTLPLVVLAPVLLAVPGAGLLWFATADPGLARFVRRERGTAFLGLFLCLHFLVHLAIVGGAAVGGTRFLLDRDFGPTRHVTPTADR
ncbi:glycosyltransferase family 2 protein [Micromonospora sp. LOL_023]|uniref:glycosyltransferase family 2 protein n=1 Tax=Micromonospora sp. LOL_023 TaxID=3345418 RepID=UPI003A8915B7